MAAAVGGPGWQEHRPMPLLPFLLLRAWLVYLVTSDQKGGPCIPTDSKEKRGTVGRKGGRMETQAKEKRRQPWCSQCSPGLETKWLQG